MSGWDNGLCQDYNRGLGRWFADRLGSREELRRTFMDIYPQTPKPVVQYRPDKEFYIKMGEPALVFPVDHLSELVTNKSMCLHPQWCNSIPLKVGLKQ